MMLDLSGTTWCWTETEPATHGAKDDRAHTGECDHPCYQSRDISKHINIMGITGPQRILHVSQPWLWNRYWMRRDSM